MSQTPLSPSRQLLVVKTADWTSSTAALQRYQRATTAADWQPVGAPIPVSLGRTGLGWGIGCHPAGTGNGPTKREGDGRAPAGIFAISELFGSGGPDSPLARAARLPYRCTTDSLKCIDDPASAHYNRFVDVATQPIRDWTSHEDMRRADARYEVGAVIAHNRCPPVAGAGSCIFLHVWQAAGLPTAGCTAGALADILSICHWLDGAAAPRLVQLPLAEYRDFKASWGLP